MPLKFNGTEIGTLKMGTTEINNAKMGSTEIHSPIIKIKPLLDASGYSSYGGMCENNDGTIIYMYRTNQSDSSRKECIDAFNTITRQWTRIYDKSFTYYEAQNAVNYSNIFYSNGKLMLQGYNNTTGTGGGLFYYNEDTNTIDKFEFTNLRYQGFTVHSASSNSVTIYPKFLSDQHVDFLYIDKVIPFKCCGHEFIYATGHVYKESSYYRNKAIVIDMTDEICYDWYINKSASSTDVYKYNAWWYTGENGNSLLTYGYYDSNYCDPKRLLTLNNNTNVFPFKSSIIIPTTIRLNGSTTINSTVNFENSFIDYLILNNHIKECGAFYTFNDGDAYVPVISNGYAFFIDFGYINSSSSNKYSYGSSDEYYNFPCQRRVDLTTGDSIYYNESLTYSNIDSDVYNYIPFPSYSYVSDRANTSGSERLYPLSIKGINRAAMNISSDGEFLFNSKNPKVGTIFIRSMSAKYPPIQYVPFNKKYYRIT